MDGYSIWVEMLKEGLIHQISDMRPQIFSVWYTINKLVGIGREQQVQDRFELIDFLF